jgi:hypothetical protein
MSLSRRQFLQLTLKGMFIIGAGNSLQSFAAVGGFGLPPMQQVKFRFALASDGQYGQEGTSFKATHQQMVEWLNGKADQ